MLFSPRRQLEAVIRHEGRILTRTLLRRGRYVVGQDRKNEIVVDQDSISSRHARLTVVSEAEITIEDCGSANGTFVNGKAAFGTVPINFESKIELGQCSLGFQRSALPASVFQHLPDGFLRTQRYRLGEMVIQGRTSAIYEAHDTALGRDVALKAMLPESQADPAQVLHFIREAQITSQLQHPSIPPIYELSVDEEGRLYYTTRFVEGESLAAILDAIKHGERVQCERYPLASLVSIFQKICDGVAFAHARGVVHGTLAPENVTVGTFGEVFVMGWSFAAVLAAADQSREAGRTPICAPPPGAIPPLSPYSAPVQASGSADGIDERVDVYALGGLLYKILTLQDPVLADDEVQLTGRILAGQIAAPGSVARPPMPHWPDDQPPDYLAALAMSTLSVSPDDPSPIVQDLQRKVDAWLQGTAAGKNPQRH